MLTAIKDEATLKMLINKLKDSDDVFICVMCGHTMSNHPSECPNCLNGDYDMNNEENKLHKDSIPIHHLYIGETDATKQEFHRLLIEVLRDYNKQHKQGKMMENVQYVQ